MIETGKPGIVARIADRYDRLSEGHRRIAEVISASPHEAALMTLAQMAAATSLSKATVNRFGAAIGLDGYKALRSALRDELAISLRPVDGLATLASHSSPWRRSLAAEAQRVGTIEAVGGDAAFARAARLLAGARRVYLAGFGSSAFLADYAAFCLSSLRDDCICVADSSGFEGACRKILGAGPQDVALQIGFARYSRDNVRVVQRFHRQKAPLICITDSVTSPFARLATACFLVARSPSFVLSGGGTGAMAVIEALLRSTATALGGKDVRTRAARLTGLLADAVLSGEEMADK